MNFHIKRAKSDGQPRKTLVTYRDQMMHQVWYSLPSSNFGEFAQRISNFAAWPRTSSWSSKCVIHRKSLIIHPFEKAHAPSEIPGSMHVGGKHFTVLIFRKAVREWCRYLGRCYYGIKTRNYTHRVKIQEARLHTGRAHGYNANRAPPGKIQRKLPNP